MGDNEYTQEHRVVFDCNVYLDAGRVLGAPFTWDKFNDEVARSARHGVPHPGGSAYDSVRALALCTSGRFAGDEPLSVWTSAHIDRTVLFKAEESAVPDPVTGYHGLGWQRAEAAELVDSLVGGLVAMSNGASLGAQFPDSNPPLDHEDGLVYGACKTLAGEDPLGFVYCVTNDGGFRQAAREKRLSAHTRVLSPAQFVQLVRSARNTLATGGIRSVRTGP